MVTSFGQPVVGNCGPRRRVHAVSRIYQFFLLVVLFLMALEGLKSCGRGEGVENIIETSD